MTTASKNKKIKSSLMYFIYINLILMIQFLFIRITKSQPTSDLLRVAVIELRNQSDLKDKETLSLTDVARGVVAERLGNQYLVMTSENIRTFVDEQTCDSALSQSCEVEVGRQVGAHFIISGAITRIGRNIMISLKVHNTKDARLLGVRQRETDKVEKLLGLMRRVSAEAVSLIDGSPPPTPVRLASDIEWVKVPAGSFEMGSTDEESDEEPPHTVKLKSFLISKTEITVEQYRRCVTRGVCSEPNTGSYCTWTIAPAQRESHPINCLDWAQARTFAKWVGADLPTEAEWEYAARGGETYIYSGSSNPDTVAWYESNSGGSIRPVKQKMPNKYGLYDMSGNVSEWVLDEYAINYSDAPQNGHQAIGSTPSCEKFKDGCRHAETSRIYRGGNWEHSVDYLRITDRTEASSEDRFDILGFRIKRSAR